MPLSREDTKEIQNLVREEMKKVVASAANQFNSLSKQGAFNSFKPEHIAELLIKIIDEEIDRA